VSTGVKIEGARELRTALKKAGADLQDFTDVNATIGRYVSGRAAAMAPKRSGALAGSIRSSKAKGSATLRAGSARLPYAGPVHWGWPRRGLRPQAFLADAASVTEPTWTKYYMDRVEAIVTEVAKASHG
jgi:hypothetical protein